MIKDEIINDVILKLGEDFKREQLLTVKCVLLQVLYPYKVTAEETHLTTLENDNEKYLMKFKNTLLTEEKAKSTVDQYLRSSVRFLDYIGKNFREICGDDVLYYLAHLKRDTTNSATSRDNERKYVKSFFNFLYDNDYIAKHPFAKIKSIRRDEKQKVILTDNETEKLRDECKNDIRDTALIDFLLATGVRVSEISALNIDDVNFETGDVSVYGIKTRKWRTVYLDTKAQKHLKDYISSRKDNNKALFVGKNILHHRLCKSSIENITKKYGKICNINKKCTVHLFRKTLASKLYRQGMDMAEISAILGHSVAVLQKYYLMIDTDKLKSSYKRCVA